MEQALSELLQQIDAKKAEVDSLRPFNTEQEGSIMQKFRLDWNYHSNAIEGNSLTYGETSSLLTSISYEYTWKDYQRNRALHEIRKALTIRFNKLNFEIAFNGTVGRHHLVKAYNQTLSQAEIQHCSEIFVKEAIQQIRSLS